MTRKAYYKMGLLLLALVLVFSLFVISCAPEEEVEEVEEPEEIEEVEEPEEVEKITLTYTDHDPPGGMRTDFIANVWLPEIKNQVEAAGYEIEINDFFGASLMESEEALEGIRDGVADFGFIFPDHHPGRLYSWSLFRLFPEAPDEWEHASWIFSTAIEEVPALGGAFEAQNQKPLLVTLGLPSVFGASYPIESLEDLEGYNWRASAEVHLRTLENIGANPVSVPWGDVYMALSTGTIDGVLTNYDGFHMMKFYEVAPNIIVAPQLWWATPFVHTFNLDTWNDLPEDVQDAILEASEIAALQFDEVYAGSIEQFMEEQREEGCTVSLLPDEEVGYIADEEFLRGEREDWIKEAEEDYGIDDAAGAIERMHEIMEESLERGN